MIISKAHWALVINPALNTRANFCTKVHLQRPNITFPRELYVQVRFARTNRIQLLLPPSSSDIKRNQAGLSVCMNSRQVVRGACFPNHSLCLSPGCLRRGSCCTARQCTWSGWGCCPQAHGPCQTKHPGSRPGWLPVDRKRNQSQNSK